MPEFDIDRPSPDAGHEAIRVAVVQAIEELDFNTADLGFSFDLTDTLFSLVDSVLVSLDAHRIRIDAVNVRADTAQSNYDLLQQQVADLTARVAALESPFVPDPPEEPAP